MSDESPNTAHGHSRRNQKTKEWIAWWAVVRRVRYPRRATKPGQEIKMCRRFDESFEAFLNDMGRKPSDDSSIDRKDHTGHYSCGKCADCAARGWTANCIWADLSVHARNRSGNRLVTHDGRSQCASAWAEETGISVKTTIYRLDNGWSEEAALTTPAGRQGKKTDDR